MGFKVVEYYLRHCISDGIERLRTDLSQIDDIFGDLACHPLNDLYGKKIIDEIKCFFRDNDIPVLSAFGQNQIQLPSITVHMISSMEDPQYRAMQDHVGYERSPKAATRLSGPLYAKAYDPTTGKLTFDKDVDMSGFIKGRKLFSRRSDEVFTLKPKFQVNDSTTAAEDRKDQTCVIVDANGDFPEELDYAELYLLSSIDFEIHRVAAAYFRETFEIRCNAQTNTDQAIWLYYIVAWVLMRNKEFFEEVGMESQTFSASDFTRDQAKGPNTIWGRTLRFNFLVQHNWKEKIDALEIVGINVNAETNVVRFISEE